MNMLRTAWHHCRYGSTALWLLCAACAPIDADNAVLTPREQGAFPPIRLQGVDRANVVTADFRGKVVVLNVWATWCPPCRKEMPSLQRLHAKLDPARAEVIGVSVENDDHVVREWLKQSKITFANYLDTGSPSAQKLLRISAYPQTFFISPDGRLIASVSGARDWDDPKWLEMIDKAASGKIATRQSAAYIR
jgi:thiol-disulfide isomerase/thioredoxin